MAIEKTGKEGGEEVKILMKKLRKRGFFICIEFALKTLDFILWASRMVSTP